jgi:hypothetical protein
VKIAHVRGLGEICRTSSTTSEPIGTSRTLVVDIPVLYSALFVFTPTAISITSSPDGTCCHPFAGRLSSTASPMRGSKKNRKHVPATSSMCEIVTARTVLPFLKLPVWSTSLKNTYKCSGDVRRSLLTIGQVASDSCINYACADNFCDAQYSNG